MADQTETESLQNISLTAFDAIRFVKDPEKDSTLEDLEVLQEDKVKVTKFASGKYLVDVEFVPTIPHCSLATLIVNKQINDKERVAAALENPNLLKLVESCISEED
ncbi:MIP18 family protein FAM96A [Armadillidium nasatum]|uniref:MIP18 family protein FAM96A n=1 Tax=Armadillidium nasatum TaxID=96803 RepID=A0A5N5SPT1_9CRUS|nr:MIP18 family protein FAM96A [Armadillidium nasatum]